MSDCLNCLQAATVETECFSLQKVRRVVRDSRHTFRTTADVVKQPSECLQKNDGYVFSGGFCSDELGLQCPCHVPNP